MYAYCVTLHPSPLFLTGLGTLVAAPLARSLCAQADTLTLNAPASESSGYGQPVDVTGIAGSDAEGHALVRGHGRDHDRG
ncbi:MAG TPA: hypothetical protein VFH80_00900 [Solirubrobacteraceae bacterium]|nr:hypothetical protein [Solirubrobacteraceae bacterium]